jgi:hypothetical protein
MAVEKTDDGALAVRSRPLFWPQPRTLASRGACGQRGRRPGEAVSAISQEPPAEIAAPSPKLIKRTELGDNDRGVRLSYANYTQRTVRLDCDRP